MSNTPFDESGRFVIEDYSSLRPFSSFLPGIAGLMGIPLWVFYVNRGQAIASFGLESKDKPVMEFQPANKAYQTTPWDSAAIYFFLIAVTLSYMYFEVFAVVRHPEAARLSFLGKYLAGALAVPGLPEANAAAHFRISWWLHILFVYGFIAYVPYSKYFHMFTGPLNLFFRGRGSSRRLPPVDIEKSEVFGIEKTADFTWKDNLDAFACMECGRCQDACPASTSGKPLSPKMILVNQEKRLLAERRKLLERRRDDLSPLFPETYTDGEIWTCTTCGACQHVCPVEIEHIRKIVGVRRSEVLMQGRFPQELNAFFRNLETNSNPWGLGFSKRADWAAGLDVPVLSEKKSADVLLWVGCAGSYDEQGIQVAKAMVTLLRKAGVDFGILGTEEKCCGDSARRLGQEYLYQTLAEENLGLFLNYGVKKIITFCPHGYNTFQNEYSQLLPLLAAFSGEDKERLARIEIISHVSWVNGLLGQGRLKLKPGTGGRAAYHDPCYLGRHNGIIKEPRDILSRLNAAAPANEIVWCAGPGRTLQVRLACGAMTLAWPQLTWSVADTIVSAELVTFVRVNEPSPQRGAVCVNANVAFIAGVPLTSTVQSKLERP